MKQFIEVMKALSDPSRVSILKMLEEKEMCVCEIQAILGLAQPTISKHLKILEEAELVEKRKHKQWVNYSLADTSKSIYSNQLLTKLKGWLNDDPQIISMTGKAIKIDRMSLPEKK